LPVPNDDDGSTGLNRNLPRQICGALNGHLRGTQIRGFGCGYIFSNSGFSPLPRRTGCGPAGLPGKALFQMIATLRLQGASCASDPAQCMSWICVVLAIRRSACPGSALPLNHSGTEADRGKRIVTPSGKM
jgi:hypothetical protein